MVKAICYITVLYGLYLIGQDATVWLMGGQSVTGLFIGVVDQYTWVNNHVSPYASDFYVYVAERWSQMAMYMEHQTN